MRAPHGEDERRQVIRVRTFISGVPSLLPTILLASCKTLGIPSSQAPSPVAVECTLAVRCKAQLAFDLQQHGTSDSAPTSLPGAAYNMLLSLITINALAASALAPARNRLPVQQRRHQSSGISMRYGRKQLKIRQRVKSDLQKVATIDDLARSSRRRNSTSRTAVCLVD